MKKISLLVSIALGTLIALPSFAHDYFASYEYLSGMYEIQRQYPTASEEEFNRLLKMMNEDDKELRMIAVGALSQTGTPKAIDLLLNATGDKSEMVQMTASMGLCHFRDKRVIDAVMKTLKDPSSQLSGFSIFALIAQGKSAVQPLIASIIEEDKNRGDKSNYEYEESPYPRALSMISDPEAVDELKEALKHPNARVRDAAQTALTQMGIKNFEITPTTINTDELFALLQSTDKAQRKQAAFQLAQLKDKRLAPILLKDLNNKKPEYPYAIELLGELGDKQAVDPLIKLLASSKQTKEIIIALGKIGDPKAVKPLAKLIGKTDDSYAIIDALGGIQDQSSAVALLNLNPTAFGPNCIEDELQGRISESLANIGKPAVKPLIKMMSDKRPEKRSFAILVLNQINDRSVVPVLIGALKDKNAHVREAAITALGETGSPEAIRPLVNYAANHNKNDKYTVACALGGIKTKESAEAILNIAADIFNGEDPEGTQTGIISSLTGIGKPAIKPLVAALGSKENRKLLLAIIVLQELPDNTAVPGLINALNNKDAYIRIAAIDALDAIGDSTASTPLIKMLNDSNNNVRAKAALELGKFRATDSKERLATLLHDKTETVAYASAISLGEMGDNRGVDTIVKYLGSGGESWREQNVRAIRVLGELKDKRAINYIINSLSEDCSPSVFEAGTQDEFSRSRDVKIAALKSITGQDFGYGYYRWIAWWESAKPANVKRTPLIESGSNEEEY